MAKAVTSRQITQPTPAGGPRIFVSARYNISPDVVEAVGAANIRTEISTLDFRFGPVWRAISQSADRAYSASGLRKITRQLWRNATENFDVNVDFQAGNVVVVLAQWRDPTIPYFFIHLFGGEAGREDSRVNIPRRNFIRYDGLASLQIKGLIDEALARQVEFARGRERARELGGRREQVAVESERELNRRLRESVSAARQAPRISAAGRRISPRTVRSGLRRSGIGASAARQLARENRALREQVSSLEEMLKQILEGQMTTVAQPFRFQVVGPQTPTIGGRSQPARFF